MNIKIIVLMICLLGNLANLCGQNILLADKAVEMTLENNFDIKRSQNATKIAENNASKYNTAKLPTVALEGAANININNSNVTFQDASETKLSWISTQNASAAITSSYTIFDGYFRKYNIEQLSKRFLLTQLQVEAAMENLAAQTLSQYYTIASIENTLNVLTESINISQQRLLRAETQVEFGQGSELNVLNAQVDLNNDSLSYKNAILQLDNAKLNLNKLMVSDYQTNYQVSPELTFYKNLEADTLLKNVLNKNIELQQIDKNIEIGNLTIDMVKARKLPSLAANAAYSFTYGNNSPASFIAVQKANGLRAGLTLNWNIFDGGSTKIAIENAKLNALDLQYQKEQLRYNLETDFNIAYLNYKNTLAIYQTNEKNEAINRKNFERTEEQFKAGQINSVDFRQAQLNLLNAQNSLIGSQFNVKISELELLLLSSNILN